jgi:acyl carrier protein
MKAELKSVLDKREYTLNKVRDLLRESLKLPHSPEELDPDTPLFSTGLGLDSIDAVMLVVDMEAEFGVMMTADDNIESLRSINSLVDLVINNSNDTGK